MTPLVRPPAPRSRGIIGNFPLGSRDPLGLYTQWARRYGDIFYYRAFSRHLYFLNNPDFAKYVLVTNYQGFIKGEAIRLNRRIFGNCLLTNEGDSWLQHRRLTQPAFHRDKIELYGNTMVAYTERMMATWHDGEARDIHHVRQHLAPRAGFAGPPRYADCREYLSGTTRVPAGRSTTQNSVRLVSWVSSTSSVILSRYRPSCSRSNPSSEKSSFSKPRLMAPPYGSAPNTYCCAVPRVNEGAGLFCRCNDARYYRHDAHCNECD